MRLVYFDLETLRSAQEVGGWRNASQMGMACGVCFDTLLESFSVYEEREVPRLLEHLRKADIVIGFNQKRFDYAVLSGYVKEDLCSLPSFDLLEDLWGILGFRVKLSSLAQATLGETKSADGLMSLAWVRQGRMDLVQEYCKKDVELTKKLFEYGQRNGQVKIERNGSFQPVPVRWDPEEILRSLRRSGTHL